MRYYFSLFVVFAGGALVLAAPTDKKPPPSVNKEHVKPGDIYWPRLKYVEPKDSDYKSKHGQWNHPVIVLSNVDAHDKVKVASISRHPVAWGSAEPASNYADISGSVNVGPPVRQVHVAHLPPPRSDVVAVRPGRLKPLIDRINANCPPDQRLPSCEPSGSAQHNTSPGRSEHDHSHQGSQPSSSNKGSSSQGSRPGSPKQTHQESSSSHGSQPGSSNSKQRSPPGSPPGSSDHGWQVVTGRRGNKARGSKNR